MNLRLPIFRLYLRHGDVSQINGNISAGNAVSIVVYILLKLMFTHMG